MRTLSLCACASRRWWASALASLKLSKKPRSTVATNIPAPVIPSCIAFHSSSVKSAFVAMQRSMAVLVGGASLPVHLLRPPARVGEQIEDDAECDGDPVCAVNPACAPDDRVHQGRPREEDEAEERPPPVGEGMLDALAEDPFERERKSRPEREERKQEAAHTAILGFEPDDTLRPGRRPIARPAASE